MHSLPAPTLLGAVVPTRASSPSPGDSGPCLETWVLLAFRWEPGMLLNSLRCTGQPQSKERIAQPQLQ